MLRQVVCMSVRPSVCPYVCPSVTMRYDVDVFQFTSSDTFAAGYSLYRLSFSHNGEKVDGHQKQTSVRNCIDADADYGYSREWSVAIL